MLLIQSIIVYSLFAYLLYRNAQLAINDYPLKGQYKNMYSLPKHYWTCIFIFCLISGIRWNVGADHLAYMWDYNQSIQGVALERTSRSYETGYLFLTKVFSSMGLHYSIYFAALAFLEFFFIMLAVRNRREIVPYMMVVMILGTYYLSWMNGIRQMIAACAFVWGAQFIPQKNWKMYLVFLIWAYLWHHSSLMLAPVFLLCLDKTVWDNKWLNFVILGICFTLGQTPTWINIMSRFSGLLTFMGYEHYTNMMGELLDQSEFTSHGFGPRMIIVFISYLFIIYYYPKTRKYFNDINLDVYFKLAFIGICGFYLFDSTGVEFRRPVQYFEIFTLPVLGYTLYYLKHHPTFTLQYLILLTATSSFVFLQCYADFNSPVESRVASLYQFFFYHQ